MPKTTLKRELTIHALTTKLWSVLTCTDFTRQFFFSDDLVSDWTEGSPISSAATNTHHGFIEQVVPGVLLRFTLDLPQFSKEPVRFSYELVPNEDGIRLKLEQELHLHAEVPVKTVTDYTDMMMQKIKWLAEYS